jgi:hypothetical protein
MDGKCFIALDPDFGLMLVAAFFYFVPSDDTLSLILLSLYLFSFQQLAWHHFERLSLFHASKDFFCWPRPKVKKTFQRVVSNF